MTRIGVNGRRSDRTFPIFSFSLPAEIEGDDSRLGPQPSYPDDLVDRHSIVWNGWRDYLRYSAIEILEDCSEEGWDGYGAAAVSTVSLFSILRLIGNLPRNIQPPEVVPEPSGEIGLEWRTDDGKILSLSVSGRMLNYAALLGPGISKYGEEPFVKTLPKDVEKILSENFSRF